MNWLYYLLESNLYLIIFYALYYLLFRRETYYQWNRAYLLISPLLAFLIPLFQLGVLKPEAVTTINYGFINAKPGITAPQLGSAIAFNSWALDKYLVVFYLSVVLVMTVLCTFKLVQLLKMSSVNKTNNYQGIKLVELPEANNAFSFLNYLFIGSSLVKSPMVIRHEMIHIKQRHSWDILYFELLKIINWFNPVIYIMQSDIKQLHEFIADKETANTEDLSSYADFLINNAYGFHSNTLTNTFFNKKLLKKRIMMLQQKRSGTTARLKFLLVMPVLAGLLCVSTLAFAKSYGWIDLAPGELALTKGSHLIAPIHFGQKTSASGKRFIYCKIDPSKFNDASLSKAAAMFKKDGYQMDFRQFKEENKPILWISLKKGQKVSTASFLIDDLIKTGYVIFVEANEDNDRLFVHSAKITFPKPENLQRSKIRDTGLPNKGRSEDKITASDTAVKVNNSQTADVVKVERYPHNPSNMLPPPSGYFPGCSTLYNYLAKHLRYPTTYFEQKTVGNVIVEFSTNTEHKVLGVKVKNKAMPLFADEVKRQLTAYTDTVNRAPGTYFFVIQFNLINEKHTQSWLPSGEYLKLTGEPDCAGNIEIVGYVKE